MGIHIRPEGWHNWSKSDAEKSSYYAEYNCSGTGFSPSTRVSWSHQLDASQAQKYTIENCLGTVFYNFINNIQ
jgi:pectinesterase